MRRTASLAARAKIRKLIAAGLAEDESNLSNCHKGDSYESKIFDSISFLIPEFKKRGIDVSVERIGHMRHNSVADISIKLKDDTRTIFVAVECKTWFAPVRHADILLLHHKMTKFGYNFGIFASHRSSFQDPDDVTVAGHIVLCIPFCNRADQLREALNSLLEVVP